MACIAVPAPILRTLEITGVWHTGWPPEVESIIFGISIFAAATLLVWSSEVAEQLISSTLALAILAIIAVLPEYAVDLYFAWSAPSDPVQGHYALANMTGANRLLIGFAWPVVFWLYYWRTRKPDLPVGSQNAVGLVFLLAATLYSFSIPLRQHLSLIDTGIMFGLFFVYLVISSRGPPHVQVLVGPARAIGALPLRQRWAVVVGIFAFAAGTVFAAAEPFANGLVDTGKSLGVEEFLLVQWVAPLASEAPEFILAAMLALRGRAAAGMTLLIASKVNQWTLLVGSLPLAYSISGQTLSPLDMEPRQAEEVFLTAAQSLFAIAVLASLSFSARESILIFALFALQLAIPITEVRLGFASLYMVLAILWFLTERKEVRALFGTAWEHTVRPPSAHDTS
ncbi:MAG: hypothetical protein WEB04_08705 [Dehalococcoidia bacterium]